MVYAQDGEYIQEKTPHKVRFVLERIPSNTPHDASIYLAGNTTGWFPDVMDKKLQKDARGQYYIDLVFAEDTLLYKFTRGSWDSVEGRKNGRARPNRTYIPSSNEAEVVEVRIATWEDLAANSYNIYMYLLFLAGIQGLLLTFAINTIRNRNKIANAWLSALLLLVIATLFGRGATYNPTLFNWQPKLILLPEIILFSYAPTFLFYLKSLLEIRNRSKLRIAYHYIPAVVQILVYLPFLFKDNYAFTLMVVDNKFFFYFAISGLLGFGFNLGYWLAIRRLLQKSQEKYQDFPETEPYLRFLKVILQIKGVYLSIWLLTILVYIVGEITGKFTLDIAEVMLDVLWIMFSFLIYCLGFYAMRQPELFSMNKLRTQRQNTPLGDQEAQKIIDRLNELMLVEKQYEDPDLNLTKLAHMVPTTPHQLSKVLNTELKESFGNFVNKQRISAFIEQVQKSKGNEGILATAYSVGFNSKTTFNRYFKKYTGVTPSEYLNGSDQPSNSTPGTNE